MRRRRGFSIYEALLALALVGIAIIALNLAAASAAVSSKVAQNRLFVQNLIRGKMAEYRSQVKDLAAQPPVPFESSLRGVSFVGTVSAKPLEGSSKLYRLSVSVKWSDPSREAHREKSILVIADES